MPVSQRTGLGLFNFLVLSYRCARPKRKGRRCFFFLDVSLQNSMKPVVKICFPVSTERSSIKAKYTVKTCMKEPAFIKTLKLKFHLLSPLIKKPKETEMGIGSLIMGFIFCDLTSRIEIFSLPVCVSIKFLQKTKTRTM